MKYIYILIATLVSQAVIAQTGLPVIKATSKSVSINDGGYLDKNSWTLSPKIRPDVYTADRSRVAKWVTFYTDIDSIRVKIKPGTRFNFMVLLNGKDSCFTQIASAIPPERKSTLVAKNDTIPFTLTAFNAIKVKAIVNGADTLNLHFDISSFGFHVIRDVIAAKKLSKVAKLQMGSAVWNAPEILPTNLTAHEMDGRFGWDLFEGKQVEINYDSNLLIVHNQMPKGLKGYNKAKIEFIRSSPCVKGTFKINGKIYTGNFGLDIGSEQAMILDSEWAAKQNFPTTDLKLIRSSVISDPRGVKYETKMVVAPSFKLNNRGLTNIPTLVLSGKSITGLEINFLGNDLLKRFNMILDLQNDYLYLKPNRLMGVKYRDGV